MRSILPYVSNNEVARNTQIGHQASSPSNLLGLLLNSQLTTVEATLGANTVVEDCAAAVRAGYNRRNDSLVVRSSLVSAGRRDFVFRMCHFTMLLLLV